MDRVKKNFGFGAMRLPKIGDEIDYEQTCRMVDAFLDRGFNYFDTAHGYHSGKSEDALKRCLTSRHPRESYVLTDKLTGNYFEKRQDIRPLFASQLEACGVDRFDFYLMHAQGAQVFEKFKRCRAYETAFELKAEGRIRHVGISFHDTAEVLDAILTEYPDIEAVQLQVNYLDFEDPAIQSKKCLDVAASHGKPVIVMEPVKGGSLANLPEDAKPVFAALGDASPASYAIRFAASQPGVFMVLSGMSDMDQMLDNLSYMQDFRPVSAEELRAIACVRDIFAAQDLIACTACRYCTDGCPKRISIPDLFACMNAKTAFNDWNSTFYYQIHTRDRGKASDCIACGKCEKACPQHLPIRDLLKDVAAAFDN